LSSFEQFEDRITDTVIYGLKKFISLCLDSNPNVLEILGTKDEHLLVITKEGQLLRIMLIYSCPKRQYTVSEIMQQPAKKA